MIKIRYSDLLECFNNEIYKHAKNKRSVDRFDKIKMCGCYSLYKELINNTYEVGKYNIFIIREPKHRLIMSLPIKDKLINHVIARKVLEPKLNKYLDSRNVASRKNMGSSEGIRLVKKYIERLKKYDNFYVLKIDIKKYFYSIDHEVLKSMLIKILNGEEYSLVCKIIDSTNADYINNKICEIKAKYIERYPHFKNEVNELPLCEKGKSLSIGNMTSQILSIFYLSSIDHFIVHDLHIPNYVRYADDFVLMHESKTELENVLKVITQKLKLEYKLDINLKKTFIVSIKTGFNFLGYNFKVKNKKTIIRINSETIKRVKKRVKEITYLTNNKKIASENAFCSIMCLWSNHKYGNVLKVRNIITKYFFEEVNEENEIFIF